MQLKTALCVAALLLVTGIGYYFITASGDAQRANEYQSLKVEFQTNANEVVKQLSDQPATDLLNSIETGNSNLAQIKTEYQAAVKSGSDEAALDAIAKRYLDEVEKISTTSSELMTKIDKAQQDLAGTLQAILVKYQDLAVKDQSNLQSMLDPINKLLGPIQDFSESMADVLLRAQDGMIARLEGGEKLSAELQKEEVLKAVKAILGEQKSN